jgi:hypothetical protein
MSDLPREIPGATAWERAVNLAGLLAELGETRLVLEAGGSRRELSARDADLPGELSRVDQAVLTAPKAGARFVVTPDGITSQ